MTECEKQTEHLFYAYNFNTVMRSRGSEIRDKLLKRHPGVLRPLMHIWRNENHFSPRMFQDVKKNIYILVAE